MTRLRFAAHGLALVVLLIFSLASVSTAAACSLAQFADDGRYVGGSLIEQIAAKADHIEIVRVSRRYLVQRTYTQGQRFLAFGDAAVPADFPEFTDFFVFELEPVEVLKEGLERNIGFDLKALRIGGYDTGVWGDSSEIANEAGSHPNTLPVWLFERPGNDGYAFIGASEENGLGSGECTTPYLLEVGQTFIALRDSLGRLYPLSGAFPLKIDVEFGVHGRRADRFSFNMQSLIPINGLDDPFLTGLRHTLSARTR